MDSLQSGTARRGLQAGPTAAAIVGFLVLVELTSGILQGYYTPLLTDIARFLGIHDADVNWFEAAQLMVSALVVPVLAKLGDMIGHRKVLLISTALTAAASWGVAFAPNFWIFIIAWAFQGFYVVWLPLEIALIYSRSHQRPDGAALTRKSAGILVAGLEFGVIAGALAGGFIGDALPGKLWLTLMIPAIAVTLCFFVILFGVPESANRTGGRIDITGLAALSFSLLLITAGLTFMRIDGPGTWWAWAAVVLGLASLVPFTRHELGHHDPLVDIRLLRQPSMWPVQLTAFLFGVSVLGAQAPLSTFARTDPATTGYGLGASSGLVSILIGVYVLGLLAGALLYPLVTKWTTPRITLMGAALLVAVGYLLFLPFHGSMVQVLTNMAIAGIGSGALVAALPSAAAAAAPLTQTGMATGLTNATKTVGGAFASCIFGIALAGQALGALSSGAGNTAAPLAGYMLVWTICGVTALVAAVALYFVPKLAFGATLPTS
ncbi:transporter [Arthrobacter sp. ERGS1:01]|uniref:MFS transporter n=1 Tax=Arthrobacter sp. ERGS1:01 TaxID=1704044 RepID=UPI0006B64FF0|nr:transporter [Arthrobacter sp. ERGS1:01]